MSSQARRPGLIAALPAALILVPVVISLGVWLLPTNPAGLSGFIERARPTSAGIVLILAWLGCAVLVASVAFSSGRRGGPLRSLSFVSVDEFHLAACAIGAVGTGWIYWSVTGGDLDTFISIWTNQEFTRFRSEFDYGVGVSTGRYASVLAGGLSLARLFTGQRMRRLDVASFVVLAATVLLNSRIAALMALSAAAVVVLAGTRRRVRWTRIGVATSLVVALFVLANYSRSATFYEAYGVGNPVRMATLNAQSYLATPTQVTLATSGAAMDGSALPPVTVAGALAPVLPPYITKAAGIPPPEAAAVSNVEHLYQGSVDLSINLTTNGTMIDLLMTYGWWALVSALAVIAVAIWLAGRFVVSGPIGAAIGGVLLYGLAETWRVFLFNAGSVHFVVLMGVGAATVGMLRAHRSALSPVLTPLRAQDA
jgi:hypothetical protein